MASRLERVRRAARKSLIYRTNSHECICETLRYIYDQIIDMEDDEKKEEITERLVDAFMMGKKMQDRLLYYKLKYKDETGDFKPVRILHSVQRTKMRKAR